MSLPLEIGLHAAVVTVNEGAPQVLTITDREAGLDGLPFGPFDPERHPTLDTGLRNWVEEQTRLKLGHVEQLYTFGDQGRLRSGVRGDVNFVSVGYLALVRGVMNPVDDNRSDWRSWYRFFPWEDWRQGPPAILTETILPVLSKWVMDSPDQVSGNSAPPRAARFRLAYGADQNVQHQWGFENWDEERVLERYELMYEAGLVDEAAVDGRVKHRLVETATGVPMLHDHRRILATAMARLRGKLKYRPLVFEVMPEEFTLTQLQQTVETLSGRTLHKQNFRRLVENTNLVEPTGAQTAQTGGRPAAIFRFKKSSLLERPAPGLRIAARS